MSDPAFEAPAIWYDGFTALRHEGSARWDADGLLVLTSSSGKVQRVQTADLRFGEALRKENVYRLESLPDFRLRLPRQLPPGFDRHLPARQEYGGWVDKLGLGKAAGIFAVASAAAVALFMTAPDWLGPRVPVSWERQLGDAMIGDFGNRLCSTPEGDAALAKLLDAVDPAREQVRAGVANIDMVNAVALPGGRVLLFDGLVQQAETPEELAGVLGHEVGHVRERHVMTAMMRQFGLSILLAGANSGIGDTAFGLASMGYSRDAEREADDFARARMAESNISPLGAAAFFERLSGEDDDEAEAEAGGNGGSADSEDGDGSGLLGWLASHPASGERASAYRAAAVESADYKPILTPVEFEDIKAMCDEDLDVEEFDFF